MTASSCVGRVGALALFLGVGAAAVTFSATAAADTGSADSPGSRASHSAHSSHSGAARASKPAAGKAKQGPSPASASKLGLNIADAQRPSAAPVAKAAAVVSPRLRSASPMAAQRSTAAAASATAVTRMPARLAPSLSSLTAAATTVVNPNTLPPRFSPFAFALGVVAMGVDYALAITRELTLATYWRGTPNTVNPTLELNGYNLVASSTQEITALYGIWTNWPGGPATIQGKQTFDVVDPQTNATLGSFDALVSSGSPVLLGSKTIELLVISPDGPDSGTGPGQIPPYGSIIATQTFGPFRLGWSYSAMPTTPSGPDVVSFKLLTPLGDIRIPLKFDAAQGIADHTADNTPIDLGNGYTIEPADPDAETYTGITAVIPMFSVLQGHQTYNVYDADRNVVGSFEGVFAPTQDIGGAHTKAIMVTKVISGTEGTDPGQVPPVGSVYNVLYLHDGNTGKNFLYSSMPSQSGDVVSFLQIDTTKVLNVGTPFLTRLNASAPPPVKRLPIAGGYSLYPVSPFQPAGINGLPPREVQVQGYQQFGVYDSEGNQVGTFDADVASQWDLVGVHSQAIMVTKVTSGTIGADPGQVPPVGSVFEYVYAGNSGFGTYYSAIPSPSGGKTKTTLKLLTPVVNLPLFTRYDLSKSPSDYTFFDPF